MGSEDRELGNLAQRETSLTEVRELLHPDFNYGRKEEETKRFQSLSKVEEEVLVIHK